MRWPAQPVLIHVSFFLRHSVVWEASYELCADTIRIEDRIALSVGLCRVLASLPGAQRIRSFDEVVAPSLDLLNQNVSLLQKAQDSSPLAPILSRIAVEIRLLSTMARTFVNIGYAEDMDITQSGHGRSLDRRAPIPEAVLIIVRKGWPAIDHVARHHCNDEVRDWKRINTPTNVRVLLIV